MAATSLLAKVLRFLVLGLRGSVTLYHILGDLVNIWAEARRHFGLPFLGLSQGLLQHCLRVSIRCCNLDWLPWQAGAQVCLLAASFSSRTRCLLSVYKLFNFFI